MNKAMRAAFDAVIVGAGPAGSTAAILLARAGWRVALVERQAFPRRKVCGECVAASNLPLLALLGLGPALASAGPELRQVVLMCGRSEALADLPSAPGGAHPWGRAMGRETLDTLLLEQARLAGAAILQPWSVQDIEGSPGGWRLDLRAAGSGAAATLQAPVAIAANGSWEALASSRRNAPHRRSGADLLAFKANFLQATLREGLLPVLALDGGYGGMVVADAGITTVACCIRRDRLEALRAAAPGLAAGVAVEAWLQRECGGVRRALRSATRSGPWLAAGPIAPGIRLHADDGLLRIGNAAGEAHPILGEGMSMALQSAALLCTALRGTGPAGGLGDVSWQRGVACAYAAQWRREFTPRLRLAAAFAQLAMRPPAAAPLMALARAWPGLLTLGARWGGKVRCSADLAALGAAWTERLHPPAFNLDLEQST
jgi:flavin-dependent dehydrogenase